MKKLLPLTLALAFTASINAQTNCSELFISEYVEGSGNNKALEIYNPTASTVSLNNYRVVRYSNGSFTGTDSSDLVGTINPFDVHVLVNGQTTSSTGSPACDPNLQALGDQLDGAYPVPTYMNGDDAVCLVRKNPYAIIDIFGKIGEDPGTAWDNIFPFNTGTGKWLTANHTLQRKATVQKGVMMNPSEFDTFLEYDTLPQNTWTGLGQHACNCSSVGISNVNNTKTFSVYPVPAQNVLNIAYAESIKEVKMYSSIGQLVIHHQAETNNGKISIPLTSLSHGVYIIVILADNGSKDIRKVIVGK